MSWFQERLMMLVKENGALYQIIDVTYLYKADTRLAITRSHYPEIPPFYL